MQKSTGAAFHSMELNNQSHMQDFLWGEGAVMSPHPTKNPAISQLLPTAPVLLSSPGGVLKGKWPFKTQLGEPSKGCPCALFCSEQNEAGGQAASASFAHLSQESLAGRGEQKRQPPGRPVLLQAKRDGRAMAAAAGGSGWVAPFHGGHRLALQPCK